MPRINSLETDMNAMIKKETFIRMHEATGVQNAVAWHVIFFNQMLSAHL